MVDHGATISPAIVPLGHLTADAEPRSGAKAYNCARLKQAGFRVPDGLVVLSTATEDDVATLEDHPWFDGLPADTRFAVRSSGIGEDTEGQSFAGIHQTLLNVRRVDVRDAVAACRRSARSSQALAYRRAKGISTADIAMGVLVQRMIQPVAAGVAFTVNPVTGAENEIVINASWGVGEALVSGQVDPDEFVVAKPGGELLWSRIGEKGAGRPSTMPSLSPNQVGELTALVLDIERAFGAAQDVEWCHDGADFWVVQSRPITAPRAGAAEIEWTRANLAEVLPDMTSPQALAACENLLNRAERQFMGGLLAPEDVLGPIVKSFGGRLYFNLSQLRHTSALGGIAPADMLRSMGHADAIEPADETPARVPIAKRLSSVPDLVRILGRHLRAARLVREHEAGIEDYLTRLAALDPHRLSDRELWAVIEEWFEDAANHMQLVFLLTGVVVHEAPVRKICEKTGFAFERLVYPQLAIGTRSVSAQQAFDLIALAGTARREPDVCRYLSEDGAALPEMRAALGGTAFLRDFEIFLQTYGHRGRYETDWSLPRYSEDPTPLVRALRAHLEDDSERSLSETASRQEGPSTSLGAGDSAEAWAAFAGQLSLWQRWTVLPRVRRSIRKIKQYYVWREQVRSDMMRVLATVRTWHLVLAERFVERGWLGERNDYFLLHFPEIAAVINPSTARSGQRALETLRALAADRRAEAARHRSMQMPLLMRESELTRLIRTAGVSSRSGDQTQLTGHPVSGGCVEAEVVVVRDPGDFGRMKRGAILVAPATDPSWTPLFTLASGVIVEVGGVLSHASTIAREYGLPALANVKHATKRLKTGERVRLDANQGIVYRLERP